MGNKFLANQSIVFNYVIDNYKNSNIFIRGKTGVGKSYLFDELIKFLKTDNNLILYLCSEEILLNREYYPFIQCLQNYKKYFSMVNLISEASKDIPMIGNTSSYIINGVIDYRNDYFQDNKLSILNETEKEIYDKLINISKKKNLIFLCDNIQYFDNQSLNFLYLLFKNDYIYLHLTKKIRFIVNYTINDDINKLKYINKITSIHPFKVIDFPSLEYTDFINGMKQLGLTKNLHDKEYSILYHLVDDHVQVMAQIINEIENEQLNFNKNYENNTTLLRDILYNKLKNMPLTGNQINEILKYASIIGMKFEVFEIKSLFKEIDNYKFDDILNDAKKISLINKNDSFTWNFAHEIIQFIFKNEIKNCNKHYYFTLAQCLKRIKPYDLYRRGIYLTKADESHEASKLFGLYLIQNFKNNIPVSKNRLEEICYYIEEKDFIYEMKQAYEDYHNKNYSKTYSRIFSIPDIYDVSWMAEKYILLSCCLTKKLDKIAKIDASEKLLMFMDSAFLDNELYVYEEVLERLIISYTHSGNIQEARKYEQILISSLMKRIKYDNYAKYQLYKIYRKSNAIYECDIAELKIKQSVSYFSQGNQALNIKDYYISLINESAVLLDCGRFNESFKTCNIALELEKQYPNINYPRPHILRSNYFISGFLCKKISIESAIHYFKKIVNISPIIPERIFLATNLSSFLAINNQVEEAYNLLKLECSKQNIEDDIEGLYDLSVNSNLIVFEYLLKNNSSKILIKKINEMNNRLEHILDWSYFKQRNLVLIKLIQKKYYCSGKKWLTALTTEKRHFQNDEIWHFFGLGFIFVSLNNWE